MKKFIQKTVFILLLLNNFLLAQTSYTEYKNLRNPNDIGPTKTFNQDTYTQIQNDTHFTTFFNDEMLSKALANKAVNEQNITINLNLDYDPEIYNAPWVIFIYNEEGFLDFAFYEGSNTISMDLPPGKYDFFTEFRHVSNRTVIVIKEEQILDQSTVLDFKPAESTNLIKLRTLDQNGEPLNPGVYYTDTNTYTQFIFERNFTFRYSDKLLLGNLSYVTDYPIEGYEPFWDFFINDVSDRYAAHNSCIGNKFKDGEYFIVFDKITNFTESQEISNNPNELIYHEEKFRPSLLGQNANKYYGFATELTLPNNRLIGGWQIINTPLIDTEKPLKAYINQYKNNMEYGVMFYPLLVDHLVIIDPYYGPEPFTIKSTSVFADTEGNLQYGSANLNNSGLILGNKYYYDADGFVLGLPHHPKFSFSQYENPEILIGNSVPITVSGAFFTSDTSNNSLLINYKGQYNEIRESDIFATNVTLNQNGTQVLNGNYMDFINQNLPEQGQIEIIFKNNNTSIDGLIGKNTTTISYNAAQGNEPPTLQMLQFRNSDNVVTSKFSSSDSPIVRIAAGDFDYTINDGDWSGQFNYVSGNNVEFYYSPYNQNDWTELELTEYPEHFQMPAFGNYYEASLSSIENIQENVWYDVRVICTDAAGNKQEQIISPAFKINDTMGVEETTKSNLTIYPNPFTNELNVQLPESIKGEYNFKVTDLTGKLIEAKTQSKQSFTWNSSSLPKGLYILSIENNGKAISQKVIKK